MRIGIIGAGALGQALAVRFVAAGEEVLLSDSRGSRSPRDLADSIGPRLVPATVTEAAGEEIVAPAPNCGPPASPPPAPHSATSSPNSPRSSSR